MTSPAYIPTTDTSKLLRKILKAAFPETKFSVRSHCYSGGSSIHIGWVDGPTPKAVDALVRPLEGASFDSMQDLKTHNGPIVIAGVTVRFAGHFIFTERKVSLALLQFAQEQVIKWWGCKPCEIAVSKYDSVSAHTTTSGEENVGGGYFSTSDLVYQLARVTSAIGCMFTFDTTDAPSPREVTDRLSEDRADAIRDEAFRATFPEILAATATTSVTIPEEEPNIEATAAEAVNASPVPDNVIPFRSRTAATPQETRREQVAAQLGHVVDSVLLLRVLAERVAKLDRGDVSRALQNAMRGDSISIPSTSD